MNAIIKHGVINCCAWEIDDSWTLTIRPLEGTDGCLIKYRDIAWPWSGYSGQIKKVVIRDGVAAIGNISLMFAGMCECDVFDIAGMDVSHVGDVGNMFYKCSKLADLTPLAGWDTGQIEHMHAMFADCVGVTDVSPLDGWNVRRVNCMQAMFKGCVRLKDASALKSWDVSALRDAKYMFKNTAVKENPLDNMIPMACPREGEFVGWKKCRDERVVKLKIPADARRSSGFNKMCRCDKAEVMEIWGPGATEYGYAVSWVKPSFVYRKGEVVCAPDFNEDRFIDMAEGIHFFMKRGDAETHELL